jgi:putative addiction module component (TIGR02574 family)
MATEPNPEEAKELSVSEKIQRVQDLWDDIARSPREVKLTQAQREEAERRLRRHEANPAEYTSWEDLRRRLEGER